MVFHIRNQKKLGAVVIGGHTQGLGITRMLGRAGIPIVLIDNRTLNITRHSRFCKRFLKAPKYIYESNSSFIRYMITICKKYKLNNYIIFPTDDLTVAYLSKNKEKLSEYYKLWTQDWNKIKYSYNKKFTYRKAKEIGLPFPKSFFPTDESDVHEISDAIDYPVIIKPAVMHEYYKKTKTKVALVNNKRELKEKYQQTARIIDPSKIIIQDVIPASPHNLFSLGSFFKYENLIAGYVGRRSRQLPMDFGKVSTFVELIEHSKVLKYSTKLLRALEYYGLSEVEFIFDPRDEELKLLEINPRTWKWHSIGSNIGINLPYFLYCDLVGLNVSKIVENQSITHDYSVKWVDIYSDIYVALKEILKRNISIVEYMKSLRGINVTGSLTRDDPLPFFVEGILLPYFLQTR